MSSSPSQYKWQQHLLLKMPEPQVGCIWVHACSMGEVGSILPLLQALHAKGHALHLTVVTRTGFDLAQKQVGGIAVVSFVPWDLPTLMRRFVARLQPAMLLLTETEFWPGMLKACQRAGVTIIGINTRISDRSFPKYYATRALWRQWLAPVDVFLPQSQVDAERLQAMGVPPERIKVVGNLKYAVQAPEVDADALRRKLDSGAQRPIVLVASTHDDEEKRILEMWSLWHRQCPDMLMVLVPRHPQRFESVAELIRAQGLRMQRWSDDVCQVDAAVVLVDAMGVLQSLYTIADVAVIGGSLVDIGGHNPLEAAVCGRGVITGPYIQNFRQVMDEMQKASAAVVVKNDAELQQVVTDFLRQPERLQHLHAHAAAFMQQSQRVLEKVCAVVEDLYIRPDG